jgi:hypothetical protein
MVPPLVTASAVRFGPARAPRAGHIVWGVRMRSARRLAAGFGLGLLLGVPALAGPALALAEPESTQVEFNGGGLGLLLCGSRPDRGSVTVRSESKVVFVNNIGQGATLQIDGENGGPIADGQAVEVQFHRGPVSIAMVPDCLLNLGGNGSYEPVTVNVNSPTQSGGTTGGSKSNVKNRTTPSKPKPSPTAKAAASPGAGDPSATVDQSPLFSLEPDPSAGGELTGEPSSSDAAVPVGDSTTTGTRLTNATSDDTPMDKGPIGLLAIIATVCVVGVSVGAIRAIVGQRASRAEFA